jgi:hypothetical protein
MDEYSAPRLRQATDLGCDPPDIGRALFHAVFAWAGAAVGADAGGVDGFALPRGDISDVGTAQSFCNGTRYIEIMSFSWGVSNTRTTPSTVGATKRGRSTSAT